MVTDAAPGAVLPPGLLRVLEPSTLLTNLWVPLLAAVMLVPWPTVFTTRSPTALATATVEEVPVPRAELKARTGVVWCTPVKAIAPLWIVNPVAPESVTTTLLVPVAGAMSRHCSDRVVASPQGVPTMDVMRVRATPA
jgi:hypothetical protein